MHFSPLAALSVDHLAPVGSAHPGAEPMLALPFFNGWTIGGVHKLSPISMDQFSAAGR